ncbi:MAG: DUF3153 domain-containing protein [Leptolyngbyaceae cyanobacterium SM1_1_3]|nr:DUF3153 domain-containing protein [Leptolyngbyaceae cyanobacterium SM1_1_3]
MLSTLEPLSLRFSLTTPWGLKELTMLPAGLPPRLPEGRSLQLGQLNHMEAVFWVPSPIGLGAAAIAVLMVLGWLIRYRVLGL